MRPGAFLTHGLLSLVTNVVSDISLTTPQPPPLSSHSTWDYGSQPVAQNLTPTYHTGIIKSQFREHGLCVYVCACLAEVGATTGLWGSTKAGHPVLFTAKCLEGKCVYWNVVRSLWEDKLRAVYLSLFMLMFFKTSITGFYNPLLSHLPFICDLIFGFACMLLICQTNLCYDTG